MTVFLHTSTGAMRPTAQFAGAELVVGWYVDYAHNALGVSGPGISAGAPCNHWFQPNADGGEECMMCWTRPIICKRCDARFDDAEAALEDGCRSFDCPARAIAEEKLS